MAYRHTQVGAVILALMAVAMVVIIVLLAAHWHAPGQSGAFFDVYGLNAVGIAVLCVLAALAWLFGSLTVSVEDGRLVCRFGPGLVRKRWPLADIREASVVRNPWYYGWGIHWTPHGWLYNVSGLRAVEIVLASGKKARIGSDEPEKLVQALRQSIAATKP